MPNPPRIDPSDLNFQTHIRATVRLVNKPDTMEWEEDWHPHKDDEVTTLKQAREFGEAVIANWNRYKPKERRKLLWVEIKHVPIAPNPRDNA
jgi:hypothetical protein